jgi:hypothetical protein
MKYEPASSVRLSELNPNPAVGISLENCTLVCNVELSCNYWTYNEQNQTCLYINSIDGASLVSVNETGQTLYSATFQCVTPTPMAALPEDSEELSYIEVCKGKQYDEMNQTLDTWNITTCPSETSRAFLPNNRSLIKIKLYFLCMYVSQLLNFPVNKGFLHFMRGTVRGIVAVSTSRTFWLLVSPLFKKMGTKCFNWFQVHVSTMVTAHTLRPAST